tara:strand:+ start:245 stop:472 length:228 start_codon:yes stop_codon:yes gene_type:complete
MNLNIFIMDGHGIYVWSSFILTFFTCLFLYLKTKKTMKKLEKDFIEETENLTKEQFSDLKKQKIINEILVSQSKN